MIHIITLSWNGLDRLKKLKQSLLPCLSNLDWKWTIKDNGSKDGTVEEVSKWGDKINLIAHKDNLQNFSEGVNYAVSLASPHEDDYLLLLNNDVVFDDDKSIKNMINQFDDSVGIVGARLMYPNSDKIQHIGVDFYPNSGIPFHIKRGEKLSKTDKQNKEIEAVTAAVMLTKFKFFKNAAVKNKSGLPGLDEKFFWCFEDTDFCLDVKLFQNKKIIYCGETNISHEESVSVNKNPVVKMCLPSNLNLFKTKWSQILSKK